MTAQHTVPRGRGNDHLSSHDIKHKPALSLPQQNDCKIRKGSGNCYCITKQNQHKDNNKSTITEPSPQNRQQPKKPGDGMGG